MTRKLARGTDRIQTAVEPGLFGWDPDRELLARLLVELSLESPYLRQLDSSQIAQLLEVPHTIALPQGEVVSRAPVPVADALFVVLGGRLLLRQQLTGWVKMITPGMTVPVAELLQARALQDSLLLRVAP